MMQEEQDRLAAALRQIPPAAPPDDLMARLRAVTVEVPLEDRRDATRLSWWKRLPTGWRRMAIFAPAAAIVFLWLAFRPATRTETMSSSDSPGIKANAVQVGHSLVASFDTVAQLPGGEPVRFRCREWQDDVVIHDDAHGVVITKSTPRVEMVPVRFETY